MTLDWPFIRRWIRWIAIGIVVAFGVGYLVIHVSLSPAMGFDGRLYAAAAREWLQGGDPWSVQVQGISLAAPPPSLVIAAPLALLPENLAGPASIGLAAVAAVLAVRMTGVGWWWLLSIPVVEGVFVGSLDLVAVTLTIWALRGQRPRWRLVGASLSVLAKIYAIVPATALGRRSAMLAGVGALVVTAPFLPWQRYIDLLPEISAVLVRQAGDGVGSPWSVPWLVPPTILALVMLGRRDGAWLLIPALWPASQVHYGVFMLPVGSPVLALTLLARVPAPLATAVIALAIVRAAQHRLDPWSWLPKRFRPPGEIRESAGSAVQGRT
jgi:hypothetical protein